MRLLKSVLLLPGLNAGLQKIFMRYKKNPGRIFLKLGQR
jgi:hypothetical protein